MASYAGIRRRLGARAKRLFPMELRAWLASLRRRLATSVSAQWATPADLRSSYRLLLGRRPDREGWLDFLTLVESGITRTDLVEHFISSVEFRQRLLTTYKWKNEAPEAIQIGDLRFYVDPHDFAVAPHLKADLSYESGVANVLTTKLSPGDTFVDVGASFGYFATLLARVVGPAGKIVAFEPGPQNFPLLLLNLSSNGIDGEAHQMALSDRPGLFAYSRSGANGMVSTFGGDPSELGLHDLVQVSTLDRELRDGPVHAMKIDVEGAEGLVLRGARETLRRWAPLLVLEFSPPALEAVSRMSGTEVLQLLTDLGYQIDVIGDDPPKSISISEIMSRFHSSPEGHLNLVAWRS
jgi:FkbM family methyltransferase